jgi:hypothetical protein
MIGYLHMPNPDKPEPYRIQKVKSKLTLYERLKVRNLHWVEKHPTNSYQKDSVFIVFVIPFHPMDDVGHY